MGRRSGRDLTGERFGRLVVIGPTETRKRGGVVWECICDCGDAAGVMTWSLTSGHAKSCGCLQREGNSKRLAARNKTHRLPGTLNPNWNPDKTMADREIGRAYPEYWAWRKGVFERDDYTCKKCGDRGCLLAAHHVEDYAGNPELRTKLENGETLCKVCHSDFHHNYGRGNNTREQFVEWAGGI